MRPFALQTVPAFVPVDGPAYECAHVFPGAFTDRQCDRVLEQAAAVVDDAAEIDGGGGDDHLDQDVRRSHISWLPHEDPFTWIYDELATVVARANHHYGFDLIGFTEELQLTRYSGAGAFYTWHQDGLDGELASRKLSVVVQLSDPSDYEGGDLELFARSDGDETDAAEWQAGVRRRGTAIAFPAFEMHRITPLVAGTRCSLVCWVGGPPFR